MAVISITIPDEYKQRLIDAICANYNYQEFLDDEEQAPNPETKNAFVKRMTAFWAKEQLKAYERNRDAKIAGDAALANVELVEIV